jgi:hypothetical protein
MSEKICLKCLNIISENKKVHYGLHAACFIDWFQLKQICEFSNLEIRSDTDRKRDKKSHKSWNSSFFHGNYKKYSATLEDESYILKVKEASYPELPDVEYVCNQIAKSMRVPVPDFYLVKLYDERIFVTKNFCKTKSTKMTLDHVYKYLEESDSFNCETLIKLLEKETKRYNDIDTFVKMCLFDSIIGNHDRHGRNIGLIVTAKGLTLSPIYDNPSSLGLESGNFLNMHWSPKGKIFTKSSGEPTSKDYAIEFIRLGHKDIVEDFYSGLKRDEINLLIDKSFCSAAMKNALKKLIHERIEELKNAIS